MTDHFDHTMREGFALSADNIEAAEFDGLLNDANEPPIEALVTAILDKQHPLSAEDLSVFEGLIDDPELDPAQRQEFLQTIWNIVVCIIDYQWDKAPHNLCGSIENDANKITAGSEDMVKCSDHDLTQNHNEAAAEAPGQKGSP